MISVLNNVSQLGCGKCTFFHTGIVAEYPHSVVHRLEDQLRSGRRRGSLHRCRSGRQHRCTHPVQPECIQRRWPAADRRWRALPGHLPAQPAITLATEASNGHLTAAQTTAADTEYQSILAEITQIGSTTNFNGIGRLQRHSRHHLHQRRYGRRHHHDLDHGWARSRPQPWR